MRTQVRERFEGQSVLQSFTVPRVRSSVHFNDKKIWLAAFLLRCLAMSEPSLDIRAGAGNRRPAVIVARESGLQRNLTPAQLAMLGLGSTIGTGLFLGSAIAVKLAGPAVILSFVAGASIALPMMWALAEMAAAHPTPGSFGLYAEMYLHPWRSEEHTSELQSHSDLVCRLLLEK